MIIEKLKSEDISSLLQLYKELVYYENSVEASTEIYDKMLNDEQYLVLVAKEDNAIVGSMMAVCCKCLTLSGKSFLVIEDVIVKSDFRRKGVGKALIKRLDEFAKLNNCAYSILVSTDTRKEAHLFYENVGFTDGVRGFRKIY